MKKHTTKMLNRGDFHHGFSRREAERLLSATGRHQEDLGRLPSAIAVIRSVGDNAPGEQEAQRFAAEAVKLIPATPPLQSPRGSSTRRTAPRGRQRLSLRLAGAAAGVVLIMSASAGVAYAANDAVPGDTLYGLDRALENIGLGDGGLEERLTEASHLVERGRVQEGLVLASDEILGAVAGDEALRAAVMALREVAAGLADSPVGLTPDELGRVAQRLRSLASVEPTANEFGQEVLDLVGSLGPQGQNGGGSGQPIDGTDAGEGNGQTTDDTGSGHGDGQEPDDPPGGSGSGNGGGSGSPR